MPNEPEDREQKPRVNLSGIHIRRLRRKRGLTLASVQEALQHEYHILLDRTSLGRIERGEQTLTDQEFGALQDLFGVSEAELLWGKVSTTSEERKRALKGVKHRYRKLPSKKKKPAGEVENRRSPQRPQNTASEELS